VVTYVALCAVLALDFEPMKSKGEPHRIVSRIKGSKSEEIAVVAAKDAASAIATVVKDRGIVDAEYIKRLVARPMGG
jgi:hypothetical protein